MNCWIKVLKKIEIFIDKVLVLGDFVDYFNFLATSGVIRLERIF